MEKALDRVSLDVVWWTMHQLGVEEWFISVVNEVVLRVNDTLREKLVVKVCVHQGSVLSHYCSLWNLKNC